MRILSELAYALENKNSLIEHSFSGSNSKKISKIILLNNKQNLIAEPQQFSEVTLNLEEVSVIHPNILITKNNDLINTNNGYNTIELIEHNVDNFPLRKLNNTIVVSKPKKKYFIDKCVYLSANGFASFLLGEAPRLNKYIDFIKKGFSIVLHGKCSHFHFEILNLLGYPKSKIICISENEVINAKQMIHATPTFLHNIISYNAITFLRNNLLEHIKKEEKKYRNKVYLSRSNLGLKSDRVITNEKKLEDLLRLNNFQIVYPEELSVIDQFNIFNYTDVLISPFGATWSNSIVRKPSSKTLILATKFSLEFARILQFLNCDLFLINLPAIKYRNEKNFSKSNKFTLVETDFELIKSFILT